MQKALVVVMYLIGALGVLAAMAAFPGGIFLLWQLDRTLHAESYRPATFTVAWAAYRPSRGKQSEAWWAFGTIDGHRERFGLDGVVSSVHGWDDLEAQVRPGQRIPVLYDPSFPRTGDTRGLRVIAYEDDFARRQRDRMIRWTLFVYGPSLLLLLTSVTLGILVGRYPRTIGITVFFLVAGAGGLALVRGLQAVSRSGPPTALLDRGAWRVLTEAGSALACPLTGLALIAFAAYTLRGQKQRKRALRVQALKMGFEFLGDADDAERETQDLGPFALFRRGVVGRRRFVWNRMRGARDGHDVLLFDYGFTPHGSRTSSWCTVARVDASALDLPPFSLAPRTLMDGLGERLGLAQAVDFGEHPHFADQYVVEGADADAVRGAFTSDTIALLEQHPGWNVESDGERLLLYRDLAPVEPRDVEAFLSDVMRLLAALGGRA